jgi:hypothetical protein
MLNITIFQAINDRAKKFLSEELANELATQACQDVLASFGMATPKATPSAKRGPKPGSTRQLNEAQKATIKRGAALRWAKERVKNGKGTEKDFQLLREAGLDTPSPLETEEEFVSVAEAPIELSV